MFSLGQPFGRSLGQLFGQALDRNSDGHSDSPPGQKIETTISLLGCTHTVSAIRQGFAIQNYFLPETRQPFGSTKLFCVRERKMADHCNALCLRENFSDFGEPSPPLFIGEQGVEARGGKKGLKIFPTKMPHKGV